MVDNFRPVTRILRGGGRGRGANETYVSRDWQDLAFYFHVLSYPERITQKTNFASSGVHALVQIENTTRRVIWLADVSDKKREIASGFCHWLARRKLPCKACAR